MISGVDALNPADPKGWIWITNPLEISVIFITAFIGMIAFACFTQGYFITRTNLVERFAFLIVMPFMFLPKIMQDYMGLSNHYISYIIGITVFVALYFVQKAKERKLTI